MKQNKDVVKKELGCLTFENISWLSRNELVLLFRNLFVWFEREHERIEGIKLLLQQDGMEIRSYKGYLRGVENSAKQLRINVEGNKLITCKKHKIKSADCDDCLNKFMSHSEARLKNKKGVV